LVARTLAILCAGTALAVLALSGCGGNRDTETHAAAPAGAPPANPPGATLFTVSHGQISHLQVVPVTRQNWQVDVQTTGTVDWDGDHTTQAITQVNGPISRILVDTGSVVKAGEPLLYVSSPDMANAVATYRKARNQEALAKRVLDRSKELLDRGAIATKDYEASEATYNDARTDVSNSLQALKIFGISGAEIDAAEKQGTPIRTELAVRSPISGVIVQKLVSPGMLIQAGTTVCFMISDVSTVWVQGHIFDHDLPSVHVGDPVEEYNAAFGGRFQGRVGYIGAFVDPATRTTPVRIVTQNPRGLLKKDMFVEATIRTGSRDHLLVVPVAAVLRDDKNEPMVYVQVDPGRFARRPVTTAGQRDGMVAITSGLQDGDQVVADGSLFLQFASTIQ
jgi:cobalt-zinc-cadmium efflux system membrane fusion protein